MNTSAEAHCLVRLFGKKPTELFEQYHAENPDGEALSHAPPPLGSHQRSFCPTLSGQARLKSLVRRAWDVPERELAASAPVPHVQQQAINLNRTV
ncbi:hypothetical protein [Fibrella arboris]|uniref:hypothetical protein n=1 Tax=Fibrella arboris TaxID=3242486 RepID=UPI00352303D6